MDLKYYFAAPLIATAEVSVTAPDGRGISHPAARRRDAHRVVISDDTDNPDAPWMVILHGLGGGPSEWAPVVSAFAGDYRVLTFAQAGSADADPGLYAPARHSSPFGFADDLGLLCGELGIRGAVFVGHSLGANAGALACIGDPGLFSRLILINGSPRYTDDRESGFTSGFTTEALEGLLVAMQVDYESWAGGFGTLAMGNSARPELANAFVDALRRLDPAVALGAFRAALTADLRSFFPRIGVPTLVVQSRDDPAVPIGVARWSATAIPAGRLATLQSTGHFPHLVDPDELITAIRTFLSDTERSPVSESAGG